MFTGLNWKNKYTGSISLHANDRAWDSPAQL